MIGRLLSFVFPPKLPGKIERHHTCLTLHRINSGMWKPVTRDGWAGNLQEWKGGRWNRKVMRFTPTI